MTAGTRPLAPAPGSAWASRRPGEPGAIYAGTFALATLPTSPFWARRYIRKFLDSCRGIGTDTADTAELLVSELVTNAVRFASGPVPVQQYPGRVNTGIIWLSVRHFGTSLLIEVFDTDANPPIFTDTAEDAENGRGLFIVDAMSKQWSYFFPPGGGKVVYCLIEIPMPQRLPTTDLERLMSIRAGHDDAGGGGAWPGYEVCARRWPGTAGAGQA
jgi:anti-sigma regulatory factor (Ser/Thr protein kinase)